ncbi:myelin-oligodendrocyte glycoprotein-like [Clarias gariepinus]
MYIYIFCHNKQSTLHTMNVRWFSFFTFLLLIHKVSMQSSTQHVKGVKGDTVVLPCVHSSNLQKVYWRYKDSTVVCDINNGAISDDQDAAYKGRIEIFPSEIQKGNFSIRLKNVTEADEGTYTCRAPNRFQLNVQLIVTERPVTRTTTVITNPRNGEYLRRADGLLTLLLGFALLYNLDF